MAKFRIGLSYPRGPEGTSAELRIVDDASGIEFVKLKLHADQHMEVMSGLSGVEVEGNLPSPKVLARLGKQLETDSKIVGQLYGMNEEEALEKAREMMPDEFKEGGVEISMYRSNQGWQARYRKWV